MNTSRSMLSFLAACALLLGGCANTEPASTGPVLPPMRAGTIARLVVDGPNAYINRRAAQTGSYVHDGDEVSTGPGTGAMLIMNEGGFIQLDQNTDPLVRQGTCLLLSIYYGRVVFNQPRCVQFKTKLNISAVADSFVHVLAAEQESRITVIEGQVNTYTPTETTLRQYDEYAVPLEGPVEILSLTKEQALARVAWTQSYFRRPADTPKRGGISALEATAAAAAAWIIHRIVKGGDEPRPPPLPGTDNRQIK